MPPWAPVTVEHMRRLLADDWTLTQIQEDLPFIEAADVRQAIAYAAATGPGPDYPAERSSTSVTSGSAPTRIGGPQNPAPLVT